MHKRTPFAEFAARFGFVILTHTGGCQESHEEFVHFPLMYRLQGLRCLFPNGLRPLRGLPFEDVSHCFSSAVLEQERISASNFHVCSHRGGNCHVSFCALSFCFTLIAFSLLPFNVDRFPFAFVFHWCSCLNSLMSGLNISGSDLLIQTSLHHGPQFLVARL